MIYKALNKTPIILVIFFASHSNLIAQNIGSAEKFIRDIYAHYASNGAGVDLSGPQANLLLSPELLTLVKQDVSFLRGEAGVLDTDLICDCQDFDLKLTKITVRKTNKNLAEANVSFVNLGTTTDLKFQLIWTQHGWRIDDIVKMGLPSLRQKLE